MPDIDAVLRPRAREFRDAVSGDVRARLDAAIVTICVDPTVDNESKFWFGIALPETDAMLYLDNEFNIAYRMENAWTVSILFINFEDPSNTARSRM